MKTTKKKDESFKMSLRLPKRYGEAMVKVWETDRVPKTRQIELGLRLYFERYRELLIDDNINIWQKETMKM